jgi:WD40 repeat protein
LRIWDLHTGYLLFELLGHTACVYDTVIIRVTQYYANLIYGSSENSSSLVPDSNVILSCSDDSTIKLWSLSTGTLIKTLRWHGVSVRGIDAGPLADEGLSPVMVASCGWDKSIQFHDFHDAIAASEKGCCTIS